MDGNWLDYIGAAVIATLISGYGVAYVFLLASARGRGAGLWGGVGLALGLAVFGSFPILDLVLKFVQMTQYYQYVRIVVVILALLVAVFMFLDFRLPTVLSTPHFSTYFRAFFLGFLIHLITPLPLDFYNEFLSSGALRQITGQVLNHLLEGVDIFGNPLRVIILPLIAFVVYWLAAHIGDATHNLTRESDGWRIFLMIVGLVIFVGAAAYVAFNGLTYEPGLVNKITNFGLNRFLQN